MPMPVALRMRLPSSVVSTLAASVSSAASTRRVTESVALEADVIEELQATLQQCMDSEAAADGARQAAEAALAQEREQWNVRERELAAQVAELQQELRTSHRQLDEVRVPFISDICNADRLFAPF